MSVYYGNGRIRACRVIPSWRSMRNRPHFIGSVVEGTLPDEERLKEDLSSFTVVNPPGGERPGVARDGKEPDGTGAGWGLRDSDAGKGAMIIEQIHSDHRAGREIFAVAGNSTFEAAGERADVFARLHDLWTAHDAMMSQVVYPELERIAGRLGVVENAMGQQRIVEDIIADLARRAEASNDQSLSQDPSLWFADFERVKAAFERLCALESDEIAPLLQTRLDPDRLAHLTQAARELRLRHGV